MKKIEGSGLEGSGLRALESNQQALEEARRKLVALQERAASGDIVDSEVRQLTDLISRLKEDQGKIQSAGM